MQKIAHQDRFAVLLVYNMNAHNFISCGESNSVSSIVEESMCCKI